MLYLDSPETAVPSDHVKKAAMVEHGALRAAALVRDRIEAGTIGERHPLAQLNLSDLRLLAKAIEEGMLSYLQKGGRS